MKNTTSEIDTKRSSAGSFDIDQTMPGRRMRKKDGRFERGDLILNRYKVLAELGQGGMGIVYKCFDEIAGIEVALKSLPPELSHNFQEMEDIKDNFQLIAKLVHQNIAISRMLEKDNSNGNYYLIMECCQGEDLRSWMRRKRKNGKIGIADVIPIIEQAANALDYAHQQMIIHRDIKPGNIMISPDGSIKILDFGLAAQIHTSMTRMSMALNGTSGTGPYMAPEQWRGRQQGPAADQYALATMTYEMLAGHLPFDTPDTTILREAVLNEVPDKIPNLPDSIQNVIFKAMSKDPAERFGSCSEFAAALAGKKIKKTGNNTIRKEHKFPTSIVLILLFLILAGIGAAYFFHTQSVKKLKRQADALYAMVKSEKNASDSANHSSGQTFARHQNALTRYWEQAESKLVEKEYDTAIGFFNKALEEIQWMKNNAPLRSQAQKEIGNIEQKIEKLSPFGKTDEIKKYLSDAKNAIENGNFATALSICSDGMNAAKKATDDLKNQHFKNAEDYANKQLLDRAEKEIAIALTLDNGNKQFIEFQNNLRAQIERQKAYHDLLKAENEFRQKKYASAESLLKAAGKIIPDEPRVKNLLRQLEPENFANREELKTYILRKCNSILEPDYYQKEAITALRKADFNNLAKYVPYHDPVADAIAVGANINAIAYLVEKENLSPKKVFGYSNETPLFYAARSNNYQIIRYLLDRGAEINTISQSNYSPLYFLVIKKDADINAVKLMIDKGADLTFTTTEKRNLADSAASLKICQLLMKLGVALTDSDDLFRLAAANNELQFIRENLKESAAVSDILCSAAASGNMEMTGMLEKAGCSWNVTNQYGNTPLHCAISKKSSFEFFKMVLAKNPKSVNTRNKHGETPIFNAASNGRTDIVKYLLEVEKVAVNQQNKDLNTPLFNAVNSKNLETVKYLIAQNADPNAVNRNKHTPMTTAIYNAAPLKIIEFLAANGVNHNFQDEKGWTTLMMAHNKKDIMKILLKHGAPVNLKGYPGHGWETPLHSAVYNKDMETVMLLLEYGADIHLKDSDGRTPLSLAQKDSLLRSYMLEFNEFDLSAPQLQLDDLPDHIKRGYYADAVGGNSNAALKMGEIFSEGKEVKRDPRIAAKWYMQAWKAGNKSAAQDLGKLFEKEQKYALAAVWYEVSGKNGSSWGYCNLAELHFQGFGVPQSYENAYKYFLKSAEIGNDFATWYLGKMNMLGLGRKVNFPEAKKWFEKTSWTDTDKRMAEVNEYLEFAKNPNSSWLFPVYGIMPGAITERELKKLSSKKENTRYYVNDLELYWEKGNIDRVMMTVNSAKWPGQWYHLGYNPGLSFNEWCAFLRKEGYNVTISKQPKMVKYQGNMCFDAEISATRDYPMKHKIELDFNYQPNLDADGRGTLYSFYIWFYGPLNSNYNFRSNRRPASPAITPEPNSSPAPARRQSNTMKMLDKLIGSWQCISTTVTNSKLIVLGKPQPSQVNSSKSTETVTFHKNGNLEWNIEGSFTDKSGKTHNSRKLNNGSWFIQDGRLYTNLWMEEQQMYEKMEIFINWLDDESFELRCNIDDLNASTRKALAKNKYPDGMKVQAQSNWYYSDDGSLKNHLRMTMHHNNGISTSDVQSTTSKRIYRRFFK